MTLQFNIGEAKDRLSQLVAAAKRGEDVMIARAGHPEVRLVPVQLDTDKLDIAARRRVAFGSVKAVPDGQEGDIFESMSEDELAPWYDGPLLSTASEDRLA